MLLWLSQHIKSTMTVKIAIKIMKRVGVKKME